MIEEQLAKIEKRMAALESKQETANDLLADILSAIRDGVTPLASQNAAKPAGTEPEKPVDAVGDAAPSIDDVRDALITFKEANDRDATLELMRRYLPEGAKPILSEIPADKYAALLAEIAA